MKRCRGQCPVCVTLIGKTQALQAGQPLMSAIGASSAMSQSAATQVVNPRQPLTHTHRRFTDCTDHPSGWMEAPLPLLMSVCL
mmetsp:Transcript_21751/g.61880  ORF Transcript_21751/g.61880 Transcript_21751/m.61880 type:complete len:83 (-) Transcript_21751:51-299(-)